MVNVNKKMQKKSCAFYKKSQDSINHLLSFVCMNIDSIYWFRKLPMR